MELIGGPGARVGQITDRRERLQPADEPSFLAALDELRLRGQSYSLILVGASDLPADDWAAVVVAVVRAVGRDGTVHLHGARDLAVLIPRSAASAGRVEALAIELPVVAAAALRDRPDDHGAAARVPVGIAHSHPSASPAHIIEAARDVMVDAAEHVSDRGTGT